MMNQSASSSQSKAIDSSSQSKENEENEISNPLTKNQIDTEEDENDTIIHAGWLYKKPIQYVSNSTASSNSYYQITNRYQKRYFVLTNLILGYSSAIIQVEQSSSKKSSTSAKATGNASASASTSIKKKLSKYWRIKNIEMIELVEGATESSQSILKILLHIDPHAEPKSDGRNRAILDLKGSKSAVAIWCDQLQSTGIKRGTIPSSLKVQTKGNENEGVATEDAEGTSDLSSIQSNESSNVKKSFNFLATPLRNAAAWIGNTLKPTQQTASPQPHTQQIDANSQATTAMIENSLMDQTPKKREGLLETSISPIHHENDPDYPDTLLIQDQASPNKPTITEQSLKNATARMEKDLPLDSSSNNNMTDVSAISNLEIEDHTQRKSKNYENRRQPLEAEQQSLVYQGFDTSEIRERRRKESPCSSFFAKIYSLCYDDADE